MESGKRRWVGRKRHSRELGRPAVTEGLDEAGMAGTAALLVEAASRAKERA